jgi:anti-sigma factor RsiW
MNRAEIHNLLHGYVDGELDAANSIEAERHLKTCAACAAQMKSLQSLRAALRKGDLNFRAPDSLRKDLRQFVRDLNEGKKTRGNFGSQWLWKFFAFGATAFALLAIILRPTGISEHDALLDEVVASHVRSLQVEHLTDVASTDQHTVKPWFNGKLDFAPDVKDFASQGFPLVGGRLDYLNGQTVAALVYQRNRHLINVFVWPAKNAMATSAGKPLENGLTDRAAELEAYHGYSIINFEAKGFQYYLVSDLNPTELNELAGLVTP